MAQITWRNIDAPDLTRALAGIAAANTGMQEALGGARTALQDFQTDRERVVSNELLAGALGASDEAGLNAFMQGDRAAQMLQSGLVNPEALAAVSQQRGNLLSQAINRTGLEQVQNDMATQGSLAEAAYALGMGEQVDPSILANALNNSRASQVLPGLASGNRLFDYNVMNSDRNFALQQQKLAETVRFNNARLNQQANANSVGGMNPFGSFSSNGKFTLNPAAAGTLHEIATTAPDEATARSWYYDTVSKLNIPPELMPAFDKAFEDSMRIGNTRRDAAGKPEKSNFSFKELGSLKGVKSMAEKEGIELGENGAQVLYHTFKNLGSSQPDAYISSNDLSRALRLASDMEKSGNINMNPGWWEKAARGFADFGETASGGILGAPLNIFNSVMGIPAGANNLPEDPYIPGADRYANDAVRAFSEAFMGIPGLSITDGTNPIQLNLDDILSPNSRVRK